jgi:hypothetical protein
MLALPQAEWTKAASFSLDFEKKCFFASPDRVSILDLTVKLSSDLVACIDL